MVGIGSEFAKSNLITTCMNARHSSAIRCQTLWTGKTAHIAYFQPNNHGQYKADSRQRHQELDVFIRAKRGFDAFLYLFNFTTDDIQLTQQTLQDITGFKWQ